MTDAVANAAVPAAFFEVPIAGAAVEPAPDMMGFVVALALEDVFLVLVGLADDVECFEVVARFGVA